MPCTNSGRATHTLLKKSCTADCTCCFNTAYSCNPNCCDTDIYNNQQKPNISELVCTLLKGFVETNCLEGFELIRDDEEGPSNRAALLPLKHCAVTVVIRNVTQGGVWVTSVIEDQVVTSFVLNATFDPPVTDDELEYSVDGVVCTTCTVVIV